MQSRQAQQGSLKISSCLYSASIDVEKHFSQKNSKQIGMRRIKGRFRPFIRSTNESLGRSQFLLLRMREVARHFGTAFPIDHAVRVVWHFQLHDLLTKKGRVKKRCWDLDNLIAGPTDCLVKAGILTDDGLIVQIEAKKTLGPDSVSVSIYDGRID